MKTKLQKVQSFINLKGFKTFEEALNYYGSEKEFKKAMKANAKCML